MKPVVTVIVRCYNLEHIVGRAIESVLAQKTNFPFEIIANDDCSKDNTRAVVQTYVDRYPEKVKLMPEAENKGLVGAYYDCILSTNSEFIACADGDDYWENANKLQRQVDFLRANPDYVLAHSEVKLLNEKTGAVVEPLLRTDVVQGSVGNSVFFQHIVNHPTAIYRRSALVTIDLYDWYANQKFGIDDYPLWIYMAQQGKFYYEPIFDVVYQIAEESVSHSKDIGKNVRYNVLYSRQIMYYMWDKFRPNFPRKIIDRIKRFDHALIVLGSRQINEVFKALPSVGLCMMSRVFFYALRRKTLVLREKLYRKYV